MVALLGAGTAEAPARCLARLAVRGCASLLVRSCCGRWLSVGVVAPWRLPVGSGEVSGRRWRSVGGVRFGGGSVLRFGVGRPCCAPVVPLVCPCSAWCSWAAPGRGHHEGAGDATGPQAPSAAGGRGARGPILRRAPAAGGKPTLRAACCAALGRVLARLVRGSRAAQGRPRSRGSSVRARGADRGDQYQHEHDGARTRASARADAPSTPIPRVGQTCPYPRSPIGESRRPSLAPSRLTAALTCGNAPAGRRGRG